MPRNPNADTCHAHGDNRDASHDKRSEVKHHVCFVISLIFPLALSYHSCLSLFVSHSVISLTLCICIPIYIYMYLSLSLSLLSLCIHVSLISLLLCRSPVSVPLFLSLSHISLSSLCLTSVSSRSLSLSHSHLVPGWVLQEFCPTWHSGRLITAHYLGRGGEMSALRDSENGALESDRIFAHVMVRNLES